MDAVTLAQWLAKKGIPGVSYERVHGIMNQINLSGYGSVCSRGWRYAVPCPDRSGAEGGDREGRVGLLLTPQHRWVCGGVPHHSPWTPPPPK